MVIGTSCMFSLRRCAVTVISWMVSEGSLASAAYPRLAAWPPRIAAIAQDSLASECMIHPFRSSCPSNCRCPSEFAAYQLLFEGKPRNDFMAGRGDQNFLLELYALRSADFADVAF